MAKRRTKTKFEKTVLGGLIADVLLVNPHCDDGDIIRHAEAKYNYTPPMWMVQEARYIYGQRVKRGEYPGVDGYADLVTVYDMAQKLSVRDRDRLCKLLAV